VAEAKVGGLATARALKSRVWQRRPGRSSRGGGGASESGHAWCRGCQRMGERWPKRRPEDWHRLGRSSQGGRAEVEVRRVSGRRPRRSG
jgi:hypothetical protein